MLQKAYKPLAEDKVALLRSYAQALLERLNQGRASPLAYNGTAVRLLSDDLGKSRDVYNATPAKKTEVVWLYGAFLGEAIARTLFRGNCEWIDNGVDTTYCVSFARDNGEVIVASPFERIFKHLEQGDEYSLLAYFIAVGHLVTHGTKPLLAAGDGRP